jgi:extracellular factor (EF) 3-hydroxypalmitic acid methyl ester biosynthesis protein
MSQELHTKIHEFVAFLPTIYEMPMHVFESELHERLNEIVTTSDNYPHLRESLRQMLYNETSGQLEQGHLNRQARLKPYGYAGDFEVIDWMYKLQQHIDVEQAFWDSFYNNQHASASVRNRKEYLVQRFADAVRERGGAIKMLDFASGPCRDVAESIDGAGELAYGSLIHCVDIEPKAIDYAQKVTKPYAKLVNFRWECANVFRF